MSLEDRVLRQVALEDMRQRIKQVRSHADGGRYVGMQDAKQYLDAIDFMPQGLKASFEVLSAHKEFSQDKASLPGLALAIHDASIVLSNLFIELSMDSSVLDECFLPLYGALGAVYGGRLETKDNRRFLVPSLLAADITYHFLPTTMSEASGIGAFETVETEFARSEADFLTVFHFRDRVLKAVSDHSRNYSESFAQEKMKSFLRRKYIGSRNIVRRLERDQLSHHTRFRNQYLRALIDDSEFENMDDVKAYESLLKKRIRSYNAPFSAFSANEVTSRIQILKSQLSILTSERRRLERFFS